MIADGGSPAVLDEGDVMILADTRLAEAVMAIGIEALMPAAT